MIKRDRPKENDNIAPSKGLAKLVHKMAMFILWPLRRPIFFVILLIALYLVPTFIGAKPNEVHLWYMNKFQNIYSQANTMISEKTKNFNLPKVEMPSMPSFGSQSEPAPLKVIDMPAKGASRKAFERAKSEPVRVDIMQKKDDITNSPAMVKKVSSSASAGTPKMANANPKKKLALVYVNSQKSVSGVAMVANANELILNKETIFLYGIYVDPNTQKGKEAKVFLDKTIVDKVVTCDIQAYTYQGIATGICTVDGININKALVENGFSKNVALE